MLPLLYEFSFASALTYRATDPCAYNGVFATTNTTCSVDKVGLETFKGGKSFGRGGSGGFCKFELSKEARHIPSMMFLLHRAHALSCTCQSNIRASLSSVYDDLACPSTLPAKHVNAIILHGRTSMCLSKGAARSPRKGQEDGHPAACSISKLVIC